MKLFQRLLVFSAAAAATASAQQIASLQLINSISDNAIVNLTNNAVIVVNSIAGMSSPSFNINATIAGNGGSVQSVKYGYGNNANVRNAHLPQFSFCGNTGQNFFRCNRLGLGRHTVTATPFSGRSATGTAGRPLTVTFTIVAASVAPVSPPLAAVPAPIPRAAPVPVPAPTKAPSKTPTKTPFKSPTTAPTKAPVNVPTTTLEGCYLRDLTTGTETKLRGLDDTYEINRVNNPKGFSIRCDVTNGTEPINFIKFLYNGTEHDEYDLPRWLDGDSFPTDFIAPSAYLSTCGSKRITVQGHQWTGMRFEHIFNLVATCPDTKAPTPTAAPVAVSQSTLQGCYLRELTTGKETELTGSDSYAVDRLLNPDGFSIRCDVTNGTDAINFIKFMYNGTEHDEFDLPRWLDGDSFPTDFIAPVPYLSTCGTKSITVQGHQWSGMRFQKVYDLVATCPVTPSPVTLAPVAPVAPVPTAPVPLIAKLELIYTGKLPHASVMDLTLGRVNLVNLNSLRLPLNAKFNVNAVKNSDAVNSVSFTNTNHSETSSPWAYCGNGAGPTYFDCPDLVVGATINITVLPFPEKGTRGTPFPMVWAAVKIIEGTRAPTISPAPTKAPITRRPTSAPLPTPPVAPPPPKPQNCTLPKLVGSWSSAVSHFPVAEAQGAMIGQYQVIVGGFLKGYDKVTAQTHILDTSNPSATWQRQDDYPFPIGVTHGAFVVVGTKFYMCGGYADGGIGMHTDVCMVYDNSKPPGRGEQWSLFTPLPNGGRAGGGMVYDSTLNALIFSAGATRPIPQKRTALDHNNTWMYSLTNPSAGWIPKAPMPFMANHMSSVTALDKDGKERHYFTGGQIGEEEHDGNQAEHFEYDAINDKWFTRKFMTIPRSHAGSSTRAIGCGFIMVAGCTNGGLKISDISYYDTETDAWTKIGDLSSAINTPVCGISNGMLVCNTGWDAGRFSRKIAITL